MLGWKRVGAMRDRPRYHAAGEMLAGRGGSRPRMLAALWIVWTAAAGCGCGPAPEAAPVDEPLARDAIDVDSSPASPSKRPAREKSAPDHVVADPDDPPADIEATAEEVLAEMSPEWRALLAEAEAHQAGGMGQGCAGCHVDVSDQWVGSGHDLADIGCIECHGPSEGHVQDENNEVLPDEVFARADMDRLCAACHRCQHAASAPDRPDLSIRRAVPICTDCHPAHVFPSSVEAPVNSRVLP